MRTRNLCMLSILILLRLSAPGMAGNPYEIERVEGTAPIMVDGILSDWNALREDLTRIEKISFINPDKKAARNAEPPNDKKDLSANFRILADRDYLYFAVTVTDEELIFGEDQYGRTYCDDAVELIFNTPWPIKMFISADGNWTTRLEGLDQARDKCYPCLPELGGIKAALKPGDKGYSVEAAVPLALLHRLGGWETDTSLEIAVNVYDDDNGGFFDSYISWVDYPLNYKTVAFTGAVSLPADLPEEKREYLEKTYRVLESLANEDWTEAETALAALGEDRDLNPCSAQSGFWLERRMRASRFYPAWHGKALMTGSPCGRLRS